MLGDRHEYSADRSWRVTLTTWIKDEGFRRSAGARIRAEQQVSFDVLGTHFEKFRSARTTRLSVTATFHSPEGPP
jgi:hypothetical protein